jgi:hypothetical protein
MTKFLDKVLAAVLRSKDPRRTMVKMILREHGWRQPFRRSAAWYPPGEHNITFGAPITVEDLRRRGYGTEADHLMTVENKVMNWANDVAGTEISWTRM